MLTNFAEQAFNGTTGLFAEPILGLYENDLAAIQHGQRRLSLFSSDT